MARQQSHRDRYHQWQECSRERATLPGKKGGSEVPPNSVAYLYSYYYGVCRQTGLPDSLSDRFGGITPPSPGT